MNRAVGMGSGTGGTMGESASLGDDTSGDAKYAAQLSEFFKVAKKKMTATYKPVFLRCLLDIGRHNDASGRPLAGGAWIVDDGDRINVSLHFLAARFVKYYWDMRVSFEDLRQTHHCKGSKMTKIINRHIASTGRVNPPTIDELVTPEYDALRQETIDLMRRYVLPLLQKDTCGLYEFYGSKSDSIYLKSDTVPFFRRYRVLIQNALNHKLAAHLEICNKKKLPRVATTINDMTLTVPQKTRKVRNR